MSGFLVSFIIVVKKLSCCSLGVQKYHGKMLSSSVGKNVGKNDLVICLLYFLLKIGDQKSRFTGTFQVDRHVLIGDLVICLVFVLLWLL